MTGADHILKNTQTTVGITFTAGDATGAVTYAVTDAAGASVASGTATNEATPAGYYTFVLAPQSAVKSLVIVWTGTWGGAAQSITTYAEVVGGHLFTVAEARAFDNAALNSSVTYPDATIREARAGITDLFEQVAGVSFIPRYGTETLDGPGSSDLWLGRREIRSLLSASVDGTAITGTDLTDIDVYPYGRLYRGSGSWGGGSWSTERRGVVVAYEHGHQSVPWDIHHAALILARYTLVPSDLSDRAISFTHDAGGFVRLSIPSAKYPTGIPTVDAALSRHTSAMVLA